MSLCIHHPETGKEMDLAETCRKAELFDFIMAVGSNDDLGTWMEFTTDGMSEEAPKNTEEATGIFSRLLDRAKSDGVYPVKT